MHLTRLCRIPILLPGVLLAACSIPGPAPETYLFHRGVLPASPRGFLVCDTADCGTTGSVRLTVEDWHAVHDQFCPAALDAESERLQIMDAIALMETLVGAQTGTDDDQAGQGGGFSGTNQLDCIAETTNTTLYLLLFQRRRLLRWHTVTHPAHRGIMDLQTPHNTAVLVEHATGERYAVDTYFHANGERPEVVPLTSWKAGYTPLD